MATVSVKGLMHLWLWFLVQHSSRKHRVICNSTATNTSYGPQTLNTQGFL